MATAPIIEVTETAALKLEEIISEQGGEEGSLLRMMVVPGPQGSFQYMLGMEKKANADDFVIDAASVKVLVDPESALKAAWWAGVAFPGTVTELRIATPVPRTPHVFSRPLVAQDLQHNQPSSAPKVIQQMQLAVADVQEKIQTEMPHLLCLSIAVFYLSRSDRVHFF